MNSSYKIILLLLVGLLPKTTSGCVCFNYEEYFCHNIGNGDIYFVEIIDSLSYDSRLVKLIEPASNTIFESDTFKVGGSDGVNCGESLSKFEIGDSVIMELIYGWDNWPIDSTFLFGLCGPHSLKYHNGVVYGPISPEIDEMEYDEFIEYLPQCRQLTNLEEVSSTVKLYPNPVFENFVVESQNLSLESIELYSITGNRILSVQVGRTNQQIIDISTLTNGVYFAVIKVDGKEIVERITKL